MPLINVNLVSSSNNCYVNKTCDQTEHTRHFSQGCIFSVKISPPPFEIIFSLQKLVRFILGVFSLNWKKFKIIWLKYDKRMKNLSFHPIFSVFPPDLQKSFVILKDIHPWFFIKHLSKGTEHLSHTLIFQSLYLCNLMA